MFDWIGNNIGNEIKLFYKLLNGFCYKVRIWSEYSEGVRLHGKMIKVRIVWDCWSIAWTMTAVTLAYGTCSRIGSGTGFRFTYCSLKALGSSPFILVPFVSQKWIGTFDRNPLLCPAVTTHCFSRPRSNANSKLIAYHFVTNFSLVINIHFFSTLLLQLHNFSPLLLHNRRYWSRWLIYEVESRRNRKVDATLGQVTHDFYIMLEAGLSQ